jgi:dTMP kinase
MTDALMTGATAGADSPTAATIPGRFVTFEGIEGVGKSTQIGALSEEFAARGIAHVVTREPGGTPLAETIRDVVLQPREEPLSALPELLLMFAARAVHLGNLIEPHLHAGRAVLCDRFTDATYAYQGAGRGLDEAVIATLETLVQGARRPDLTILLDAPVAVALGRAVSRRSAAAPDRFERERTDFFERVRTAYLRRAAAEPRRFRVVDATRSATEVRLDVLAAVLGP